METKPYNLQSPEQIAKDYGGNKQKIAEAMQMGILDPTAGTMAAMFIDRVRQAAQQEMAPQQTVAQRVFAPPQPQGAPAGLGATPQAGAMPAPQGAPAGLGATPEAAAMPAPEAAPMGMAMGGMVPPYASGGLTDMPLPDGMFDEPSNGGYGDGYHGGGLVAFAGGTDENGVEDDEIVVEGQRDPESYYGFFKDPELNMTEVVNKLAPRQTKYSDKLNTFYEKVLDPEEQRKRRKEDMWMTLGQIGARMAQTPGSIFQAASAGIGEALPGALAAAKERRAEQRDAIKTLAQQEGLNNREAREVANIAIGMSGKYGEYRESDLNRKQQKFLKMFEEEQANKRNAAQVGANMYGSRLQYRASIYGSDKATERDVLVARRSAARFFDENLADTPQFKRLKVTDPNAYAQARQKYINDEVYGPTDNSYKGFSAEPIR